MNKTNVVRLLEVNKIPYDIKTYEVDDSDLSGTSVAQKINVDEEIVFKTLVAEGDKTRFLVLCIPVNTELDLKKAAKISGNKSVELIHAKDLLSVTGYIRGGCSPIGMKKKFPTYIDETAQLFNKIYFSAGVRGMQVGVNPNELLRITESIFVDLT